jgi:hypothetical protein
LRQALATVLGAIVAGCATSGASSVVFPGVLDLRPLPGHWIDDCGASEPNSACIFVSNYREGDPQADFSNAMDAYIDLLRKRGWELVDLKYQTFASLQWIDGDRVARCLFLTGLGLVGPDDQGEGKLRTSDFIKFSIVLDPRQASSCRLDIRPRFSTLDEEPGRLSPSASSGSSP